MTMKSELGHRLDEINAKILETRIALEASLAVSSYISNILIDLETKKSIISEDYDKLEHFI